MGRVLVAGLGGFIGRNVPRFLLDRGFEVCGIGRSERPADLDAKVDWVRIDLFDHAAAAAQVKALRASHCLDLAWHVEHGKFWRAPGNLACAGAAINLLQAFAESGGKRFVGAGTCAEYDWSYGYLSENVTPRRPHTPFGRLKNALFEATMAHAETVGISAAWGRIFFLYGPRETETRLVPHVITSLLGGRSAKTSHGEQIRDFLHVEDVAGALAALTASEVGGAVNIASGRPVAVKAIIGEIGRQLGRMDLLELGAIPTQPGEPPLLVGDVRRLGDELGFRPRWTLEDGLAATIESYRTVQWG
jgi:nucleoside-diphosphate-sugar epimerase